MAEWLTSVDYAMGIVGARHENVERRHRPAREDRVPWKEEVECEGPESVQGFLHFHRRRGIDRKEGAAVTARVAPLRYFLPKVSLIRRFISS
jgi:hypothetical protein